MSEATATDPGGATVRAVKGAFAAVDCRPHATSARCIEDRERTGGTGLPGAGRRGGSAEALKLAGIIALSDPPRTDSAALITELRTLGVRTVMVTGDAPATAAIVAHAVGLDGKVCPPGPIPDGVRPEDFAVFAGVLPEGKVQPRQGVPEERPHCWHVRRRRQRRAGAAPGADGNRGVDGDRCGQVGGRHRADQARTRRHRRFGKRRPRDVSAHPDLHAQLGYQENRAGALPGGGSGHDRTRDPDSDVDGHYHAHRRPARHVLDDGQRAAVPDAQCLANRPIDDRGCLHGSLRAGLLYRRPGHRQIPPGSWNRRAKTLAFVAIVFGNQATTYTNRERQRWGPLVPAGGSSGRP
jgi:hypothetical protein